MIAMYDLDDNILFVFYNYKACAKYFDTSEDSIRSYICRQKKGIRDKKRDKKNHRWVRLYKMEDPDDEE